MPPVAATLDYMSMGASYLPLVSAVCGLLALLYGLFVYRAFVGKAMLTLLRKLTRSKGR